MMISVRVYGLKTQVCQNYELFHLTGILRTTGFDLEQTNNLLNILSSHLLFKKYYLSFFYKWKRTTILRSNVFSSFTYILRNSNYTTYPFRFHFYNTEKIEKLCKKKKCFSCAWPSNLIILFMIEFEPVIQSVISYSLQNYFENPSNLPIFKRC